MEVVIKEVMFINAWLKRANSEPTVRKLQFSRLGRSNQGCTDATFYGNKTCSFLGERKMYPAALPKQLICHKLLENDCTKSRET